MTTKSPLGDYSLTSRPLSTMTILHALVGYLASTALPFHSFAFASPLAAINYDGYVDITQTDKDSALMERVPRDFIEARQAAMIISVVELVIFIVVGVAFAISWISENDPVRANDVDFLGEHFD